MNLSTVDACIIALFDRATTAMQRRGWLPLNTLIMGHDCLFWATGVAANIGGWWVWPIAVIAAVGLWNSFTRWREAHGYWENHRKAQFLNAVVLLSRDDWHLRLFIFPVVLGGSLVIWQSLFLINNTALICMGYLRCCRYLGPGDFARQKRESLSGAVQEG